MKGRLASIAVVAGVTLVAVGAGSASQAPLLAAVGKGSSTRLATVDPLTLQPVGRSTQIGRYVWPGARSPDGSRMVLAASDPARVRVVDLKKMKTVTAFKLGGSSVNGINWVSPRLMVAVVDPFVVIGADPLSKRVLWRRYLPNRFETFAPSAAGFVVLVLPTGTGSSTTDPTPLISVDAGGQMREVVLERIRSGVPDYTTDPPSEEYRRPGLAIDRVGNRAFVVGAGEPIAEVDLATMAVTYHGGSRTLAKAINGPERDATWLGNGLLAVTGIDAHSQPVVKDRRQDEHWWYTPAGLTLVDTKDWSSRMIDPGATSVTSAGGLVLASAWLQDSAEPKRPQGMGVTAYDLTGNRRFHLFDGPVGVQVAAGLAYLSIGSQIAVVDVAAGRVVKTLPDRPVLLFSS
jgi:hypothetical protein